MSDLKERPALRFDDVTVARFRERTIKAEGDQCWGWRGTILKQTGRATFWAGRTVNAARYSFLLASGMDDSDVVFVCHHCDNPECTNPKHLYAGTPQSNIDDMWGRGRAAPVARPQFFRETAKRGGRMNNWSKGTKNPKAKLSEQEVLSIYRSDEKSGVLARRYGVTIWIIYKIRDGRLWSHVTGARHEQG